MAVVLEKKITLCAMPSKGRGGGSFSILTFRMWGGKRGGKVEGVGVGRFEEGEEGGGSGWG